MSETFEGWFNKNWKHMSIGGDGESAAWDAWNYQEKKLQAERVKVALLREAVGFYGEKDSWVENDNFESCFNADYHDDEEALEKGRFGKIYFGGKKARQALEKLKEIKGEE